MRSFEQRKRNASKMRKFSRNRGYLYVIPCAAVTWTLWSVFVSFMKENGDPVYLHKSRVPLAEEDVIQCIPSGIVAFPPDFLSQEQRRQGGVVIHVVIVCYICAMMAVVCDEYFVPALETIAEKLNLSPDVAGATFMAMGASAPELFSSIAGSFVTEDDIGLGTILGSAVFNILGISGIVGVVLWNKPLSIQKYPVIRDCIVYGLTVLVLSYIIFDNIVFWWEALALVVIFFSYILLMHFNTKIESAVQDLVRHCQRRKLLDPEKGPLLKNNIAIPPDRIIVSEKGVSKLLDSIKTHKVETESDNKENLQCCCMSVWSVIMWLPSLIFRCTIPSVRWYPATFILSIAWMGGLSYIAVWMVTIIGYTLSIPDSVSGLTLLAAGSSVPDLIATVMIAKSGKGNMAISNLLGSNTFDLAFCLGTPWLIKTLTSGHGRLLVYSSAMIYTVTTLMATLVCLLITFQLNGWKLNKISGIVCINMYVICITLACLYELNIFGEINKPACS